ncbi:MAG TPA: galactokinase family protein [Opitutaceae bacterium]|nr:galactokinase family protein [Opitutaceae bacterium]
MQAKLSALFLATFGRQPEVIARARGRIEFVGDHTDYNGGTVLGAAIDRNVWVAIAKSPGPARRFYSDFSGKITVLPSSYLSKQGGSEQWVNYPLGVLAAMPVFGLRIPDGFDLAVISDLPAGAGLSSSAALEIASTLAFLAITGQEAPRETIVAVGRHAENHFVGVPCGILDQGSFSSTAVVPVLRRCRCRRRRTSGCSTPIPNMRLWMDSMPNATASAWRRRKPSESGNSSIFRRENWHCERPNSIRSFFGGQGTSWKKLHAWDRPLMPWVGEIWLPLAAF